MVISIFINNKSVAFIINKCNAIQGLHSERKETQINFYFCYKPINNKI